MLVTKQDTYPEYYEEGMPGYVLRDWEVVDYECFELGDTGLWFRGPNPGDLEPGTYFTAIGAAQTFGCFCQDAYPALLEEQLGLPALNLGYSGAGPSFFLQHPSLLEYVNRSAFCIVQVMSGRSVSNSFLENPEGLAYGTSASSGSLVSAETAFRELLKNERTQIRERMPFQSYKLTQLWMRLFPPSSVRRFVEESREHWLEDYKSLMDAIHVPKLLFWFSERSPSYTPNYNNHLGVFNKYPHLVNASMVRQIRRKSNSYVQCVSDRGLPQPLVSRFTGKPITVDLGEDKPLYEGTVSSNSYYPSPEMQEDAAAALAPSCNRVLTDLA